MLLLADTAVVRCFELACLIIVGIQTLTTYTVIMLRVTLDQ